MGLKDKILNLVHQNTKGLYFTAILEHFTKKDCKSSDVRGAIWGLIEEQKLYIDGNNLVIIHPDAQIRITRNNFNSERILELLENGQLDLTEALRLLEEASQAYSMLLREHTNLKESLYHIVDNLKK